MVGIVKREGDLTVVERFSLFGAVENNVGHALAAQHAGALFAEHPAHSVADVAFAAAVGAYDTRNVLRKNDLGTFGERFETVYLKFG